MKFLVTGCAGFIGHAVSMALLEAGHSVSGVDSISSYYSVTLKRLRLARLHKMPGFEFHQLDLATPDALMELPGRGEIDQVIHLAAQAGVRHSMDNPFPYVTSNVVGHLSVLEFCRRMPRRPNLIYASSSSVYGVSEETPLREDGIAGPPASLYAVTKQADELMSQAYSSLYGIVQTGLRFFTVYGPWGRPDMAYWIFTRKAYSGEPVKLFNYGKMERDFTYIDDAVTGVMAVALSSARASQKGGIHQIYNLGSGRSESLQNLVDSVAKSTGCKVDTAHYPHQPGDVKRTCADISKLKQDYGYAPKIQLEEGINRFVDWYNSNAEFASI
ncbi:MAG: NAD-dependent epimerase/dehydratase family protein [Hyphomonadaceae bacterium]